MTEQATQTAASNVALATIEEPNEPTLPARVETNATLLLSADSLDRLMAVGKLMASGKMTVPRHLQGNVADCTAVAMQAAIWNMNPFAVAQKTHEISGRLGYEAQLVIAVVNGSPALRDRLAWEWFGPWEKIVGKFKKVDSKKTNDDGSAKSYIVPAWEQKDEDGLGVRVRGRLKGEEHFRDLELLLTQARTRNSTLWTEDPKQQLAYLAAKRWSRLHMPDVVLGVYTPDELEDIDTAPTPRNMGKAEEVQQRLTPDELARWRAAAEKGVEPARKFWLEAGKDFRAKAVQAERDAMWEIAQKADKARTVDAGGETTPPASETKAPPSETKAPAAETVAAGTDDFVDAMERAERGEG